MNSIALGCYYKRGQVGKQLGQRTQPSPSPSTNQQGQNGSFGTLVSGSVGDLLTIPIHMLCIAINIR